MKFTVMLKANQSYPPVLPAKYTLREHLARMGRLALFLGVAGTICVWYEIGKRRIYDKFRNRSKMYGGQKDPLW